MSLSLLNSASTTVATELFLQCCSCARWAEAMVAARPYDNLAAMLGVADQRWSELSEPDYLEAFDGHPTIGDVNSLKAKYRHTKALAAGEQSGVNIATDETIAALAKHNQYYQQRFGFIFIVCATGKSADEMLVLLLQRIDNDRDTELRNACEQQRKIFHIRLEKLL